MHICSAQLSKPTGCHYWVTLPTTVQRQFTTMSSQAAHDLSISELLRVLNDKLGLEYTRIRETGLSPAVSTSSLETDVSIS